MMWLPGILIVISILQYFTYSVSESRLSTDSSALFITHPRIIGPTTTSFFVGESLQISVQVNDWSNIVIELQLNKLVSTAYKVLTQGWDGLTLIPSRRSPSCQYQGMVRGYENTSVVVLSLCDGIRGKIQFGHEKIMIRPVNGISDNKDRYHDNLSDDYGNTEYYWRSGYNDYHGNREKHIKEMMRRVERWHELYEEPIYEGEVKFGHVDVGKHDETMGPDIQLRPDSVTKPTGDKAEDHHRSKRLTSYTMNQREIMAENARLLSRRFLKISMVIDKAEHDLIGSDVQKSTDFAEDVVNHIASKYHPYNIIPVIVQLEIWTNKSLISMPDKYTKILDELAKYRRDTLVKKASSDITIMITGVKFTEKGTIGGAYTDQMCDDTRSSNVNYDVGNGGGNVPYLATLIAHEIGHVMGSYHDTDFVNRGPENGTCQCPCHAGDFAANYTLPEFCGKDDRCIMYPVVNRDYTYFSMCTRRVLEERTDRKCLHNPPHNLTEKPVCGNAIVEDNEECDCGSDEDCPYLDHCCEIGTCRLKNTSHCYTGDCCSEQCEFLPASTLCREKRPGYECDLEERCSGTHSECPDDTYIQDGRQCQDAGTDFGFCSKSDCMTLLSQCKFVFGPNATLGAEACWNENLKGYWRGNCGYTSDPITGATQYHKCEDKDIFCGTLKCNILKDDDSAVRNRLRSLIPNSRTVNGFWDAGVVDDLGRPMLCATIRFKPDERYYTAGDEDDESMGFIDWGLVQPFTACGEKLFCNQSHACTYKAPPTCPMLNSTECAGNGLCNNLDQCFCNPGWEATDCSQQQTDGKDSQSTSTNKTTVVVVVVVLVVVVLGLIGAVLLFKKEHVVKMLRFPSASPTTVIANKSAEQVQTKQQISRPTRSAPAAPSARYASADPVTTDPAEDLTVTMSQLKIAPRRGSQERLDMVH